jgi:hypothetical protein
MNGSGGGSDTYNGLWKAVERSGDRLWLENLHWSRFTCALYDHADHVGQRAAADRLVAAVQNLRATQPGRNIYFVSFSSGNRVALDAASKLPPGSVTRIILLAPSVVYSYDLGPALAATRDGIDSFYSTEDNVLEGVVSILGTADGHRAPAAGRIGFWIPSPHVPSYSLYAQKLRQYPWQRSLLAVGHTGQHSCWNQPAFLQAYVVPMLTQSEAVH